MSTGRARVLPVLVVLASVAYLTVLLVAPGSAAAVAVDDVGNLASPLLAGVLCGLAARRCGGWLRRCWWLLAASAVAWASGQAVWCWYELVLDRAVPFPGPADVGYLLAVPLVLAALLSHPQAPRPVTGRLRLLGDGVLVGASLLSTAWRVVLQASFHADGVGPAQLLALAYPVLDVVLLTVVVLLLTRANRATARPLLLVGGWLAAGTVGHLVYGALAQAGLWTPGGPVDAAWGLGFLLLAAGARLQQPVAEAELTVRRHVVLRTLLPYLPVVLALVAAGVDRVRGRPLDGVAGSLLVVVVVVAGVRQLTALLENGRLTHHLEAVVAERTAQLLRLAQTDPLTGLANRDLLSTRTREALDRGPVAVALLDLDGFKAVNDSLGHEAGDRLLVEVASRLDRALLPGETVGRLGGDEFAVVLPGVRDDVEALAAADRLLAAATGTARASTREVDVAASLGVVVARPGDSPADLLRNADVAMYAAKELAPGRREGRAGSRRLFEPSMHEAVLARVDLEADLREALARGQVVPHFQPVVDLRTGALHGVEALARWVRADGTSVPPSVFVPLAEQCGLVRQLGRSVLRASCAVVAEWHRAVAAGELASAPALSVNVSAVQLASPALVDEVRAALADTGLPSALLVLEITETAVVEDPGTAAQRLAELRALGVRIALDDFGTGYSALGLLPRLPIDVVKIDREFVREVHLGPREAALSTAVLSLAASLGLSVVAEGVELAEQADRLRALGCPLAQGFLYSPALPPEQLRARLPRALPLPRTSPELRAAFPA
ncbi:MAG: diguanylate cyclase/phosphodiesterase [Frankiales bacterium]|nr:diguanylate cyclase/phosphodiesterase [Frankiales bacterium]